MPTNIVEKPQEIYQIKVTLLGTDPPIWRRLLIPADLTLEQLHDVLQSAMGWEDCHLHEFRIGKQRFGKPDPMEQAFGGPRTASERTARLFTVLGRARAKACTPMTSAIAGITKSWSKNAWRPKRGEFILPAWRAKGMDRLKTVAACPASTICWKPSLIPGMNSTKNSSTGSATTSIQRPSQSTRSTNAWRRCNDVVERRPPPGTEAHSSGK